MKEITLVKSCGGFVEYPESGFSRSGRSWYNSLVREKGTDMKSYIETILETILSSQATADTDAAGVAWVDVEELGLGNLDLNELADVAPCFGYTLTAHEEVVYFNGHAVIYRWARVDVA